MKNFKALLGEYVDHPTKKNLKQIRRILTEEKEDMMQFLEIPAEEIAKDVAVIESLEALVKANHYIYNDGDPILSDPNYDILFSKLEAARDYEPDYTVPLMEGLERGFHAYPELRGSMDKVYFLNDQEKDDSNERRSLMDWIKTSEKKLKEVLGKDVDLLDQPFYVFPKYDGISVIFEYDASGHLERALTRGFVDTNEGVNVTKCFHHNFAYCKPPVETGKPFGIKTELMVSERALARYNEDHPNKPYKTARGFCSAILRMNGDDVDYYEEFLTPVRLRYSIAGDDKRKEVLDPTTLTSQPKYYLQNLCDKDLIREAIEYVTKNPDFRTDGAVFYLVNPILREALGRSHDINKAEVAFKCTEEIGYSKILGCEFRVGATGQLTPVLYIEPIELKDRTIQRIDLGSTEKLLAFDLHVGDKIKVLYDIRPIGVMDDDDPKCKRHEDNEPIGLPDRCPICGDLLSETPGALYCRNSECPAKIIGMIVNHLAVLSVQNVGVSFITELYYAGIVKKIQDIYKISKHKKEILAIDNIGKGKYKRAVEGIDAILDVPIDRATFLASLCIPYLSFNTFRKILNKYSYEDLLDICDREDISALTQISGIGNISAQNIISKMNKKKTKELIDFLEDTLTIQENDAESPLYTVCFSSFAEGDPQKKTLVDAIRAQGGAIEPRLTKSVGYLIVPNKEIDSNKVHTAKQYGIPIYTALEFLQKLRTIG